MPTSVGSAAHIALPQNGVVAHRGEDIDVAPEGLATAAGGYITPDPDSPDLFVGELFTELRDVDATDDIAIPALKRVMA